MSNRSDVPLVTASQHYTMDASSSSLRFVSPYQMQWLTTLFLALGTLFMVSILVIVTGASILLVWGMGFGAIVFLPFIGLGGLLIIFSAGHESVELLWQVIGKEVMQVDGHSITLRHQILSIEVTRYYTADSINGVFISPVTDTEFGTVYTRGVSLFSRFGLGYSAFRSFTRGRVALKSGKTVFGDDNLVHFGSSLDEYEAQRIVDSIQRKFPRYKLTEFTKSSQEEK